MAKDGKPKLCSEKRLLLEIDITILMAKETLGMEMQLISHSSMVPKKMEVD